MTYKEVITEGINRKLSDNFKKNFQISDLGQLVNIKSEEAEVDIDTVGTARVNKDNKLSFRFYSDGVAEVRKLNNVVFIDSPAYLKVRKGLQKRLPFQPRRNLSNLSGYPEYLENLFSYIDIEYIDEPDLSSIAQMIREELAGQLTVTRTGDINYRSDEGETIPLSLMAMGISNLGLIELLLRNNTISKGSFLIIDEPEAHLHPKWQVLLMEVLFAIAESGANVIIATHSLDMLKKLERIAKENSNAEELIAVHKMPGSKLDETASLQDKIGEVLEDLSTPFYNMYMEDIN